MATRNLVNKDKPSFKQQNLPAWQPVLTAGTVLPTFFLIGVAFVPIGIGLLMSSAKVQEITLDYTDCKSVDNGESCASIVSSSVSQQTCKCKLDFELTQDFRKDIYAYYGLSNFYQNHRRYVKSRDDYQLLGNPRSVGSECFPFDYAKDVDGVLKPIAPCGAIANSFSKRGIAWSSDKKIRFQNSRDFDPLNPGLAFNGTVKPPNWKKAVYELAPGDGGNNGFQNEDLIIWMRTAALPTFRKLYGIVLPQIQANTLQDIDHLPRGNYSLYIDYNYPVTMFNGRKRFILSNTSWLGGKNNFLGIAYIVVGCICFMISSFFLIIHKKVGRLPSEIIRINQNTPYLSSN